MHPPFVRKVARFSIFQANNPMCSRCVPASGGRLIHMNCSRAPQRRSDFRSTARGWTRVVWRPRRSDSGPHGRADRARPRLALRERSRHHLRCRPYRGRALRFSPCSTPIAVPPTPNEPRHSPALSCPPSRIAAAAPTAPATPGPSTPTRSTCGDRRPGAPPAHAASRR